VWLSQVLLELVRWTSLVLARVHATATSSVTLHFDKGLQALSLVSQGQKTGRWTFVT
jgi:hypothetical protein